MDIDARDFGRLEADVDSLKRQIEALTDAVEAMNRTLSEARGGWRTLMWVGGAAGSLGGLVAWLVSHLKLS